jgi:hypothetical protein
MDIRIQLANHLLTRANIHSSALWLLSGLLGEKSNYNIYNDAEYYNWNDWLGTLVENAQLPNNFDTRAELMQGLINNDKLSPVALKILASIINGEHDEDDELPIWFNETIWQNYLHRIGVDELYEYAGTE